MIQQTVNGTHFFPAQQFDAGRSDPTRLGPERLGAPQDHRVLHGLLRS